VNGANSGPSPMVSEYFIFKTVLWTLMICLLLKKVKMQLRRVKRITHAADLRRAEVSVFDHHKLMPTKPTYREE